jgi:hypothetical protein
VIPAFERRLREFRSRILIRAWDYRQRHHARGVWFRLRLVLANARDAYVIPREEALKLIAEGLRPEPVGQELEPPRLILFVSAERVASIADARPLPVRLDAELLGAECLALTPFEIESRGSTSSAPASGGKHLPQDVESPRDHDRGEGAKTPD